MKKIITIIVIAVMLATMFISVSAAPQNSGIGLLKVLYSDSSKIKIDGQINPSEWNQANSTTLKCGTNMYTWTSEYKGEIQFYYTWCDDGFYIAAKIIDTTFTPSPKNSDYTQDRFMIFMNPCGVIYNQFQGLVFSFSPKADNTLEARKHCWAEGTDDQITIKEYGYKGAYTVKSYGWDMEAVIPWSLIASKDRVWDIIDYSTQGPFCSVLDPRNADRERAFAVASISYVDMESVDGTVHTARTVNRRENVTDWTVSSYDIIFKFYMKNENTQNENIKPYTISELKEIFIDVDWSSWEDVEDDYDDIVTETKAPSYETYPPVSTPTTSNQHIYVTDLPSTEVPSEDDYITDINVTDVPSEDEHVTDVYESKIPDTEKEKDNNKTHKDNKDDEDDEDDEDYIDKEKENKSSAATIIIILLVVTIVLLIIAIVAAFIIIKGKKKDN